MFSSKHTIRINCHPGEVFLRAKDYLGKLFSELKQSLNFSGWQSLNHTLPIRKLTMCYYPMTWGQKKNSKLLDSSYCCTTAQRVMESEERQD